MVERRLQIGLVRLTNVCVYEMLRACIRSICGFRVYVRGAVRRAYFPFFRSQLVDCLRKIACQAMQPILAVCRPTVLIEGLPRSKGWQERAL